MASTSKAAAAAGDYHPPPEDKRLFYVEKVLDRKFIGDQKWYLIKWVGYPSAYNSWESLSNLEVGHENVALIDGDVVRLENKMARKGIKKLDLKVKIRRKREMYRVILNEVDEDLFVKPLPIKKRKLFLNTCTQQNGARPKLIAQKPSISSKAKAGDVFEPSDAEPANPEDEGKDSEHSEVSEDEIAAVRITARNLLDEIGEGNGNGCTSTSDVMTFHAADEEMDDGLHVELFSGRPNKD